MSLFGTAGIRGAVTEVTPELALAVGAAVAERIREGGEKTTSIVVARDGRETGQTLANAVAAGITSRGLSVRRAGQLPTPALAFASRERHGIMLTASHNPPADNGLKLFVDGREYDHGTEREIEQRIEDGTTQAAWDTWGESEHIEPLPAYRGAVTAYAERFGSSLEGRQIAVDCGTGMASLATPQVLTTLDGEVQALNANVDGHFPARESKPTGETLGTLRQFIAETPATCGIGHDGDADRIVLLDAAGDVIHEDTVLAILAEQYVRESPAADPVVVTTPNTSGRIDERVDAAGGRVERVRLGRLHEGITTVREAGSGETEVVFAAEPWKHIHPRFGAWMDSIVSAAVLSELIAEYGLETLREPITERPYRKENVPCPDEKKKVTMAELHTTLPERFPEATVETDYGVRLDFGDGSWTLVRPSGTEPYIRVYAESEKVDSLIREIVSCVEVAVPA